MDDIVVRLGLDDISMKQGLDRSAKLAKRKAWQIAKDFDRAERAKARVAAEKSAKIQRAYQRMGAAANVAAIAAAAGIGVMSKALTVAAEENRNLAADLADAGRAGKEFFAALGNDLAPFVKGVGAALDKINELRRSLATGIASWFSSEADEVDRLQRRAEALDKQHAQKQKAQDLGRAIDRMGGGTQGDLAAIVDERRAFMQRLNGLTNGADKEALRARATAHFDGKVRAVELAAAEPDRERARRIADAEASVLAVKARQNPLDRQAFFAAEQARFLQQSGSVRAEVYGRGGTIQENEAEIQARTEALRAEMGVRKQAFLDRVAQHEATNEKRAEAAVLDAAAQRAEIERLKGNEKLAEKLEIVAAYEKQTAEIRRREGLTDAQRSLMLSQAERLRDLRLGGVGASETPETPGRVLKAGTAGGATLVRQIFGAAGTRPTQAEDPVAKNTGDAVTILGEIRDKLAGGVPAVAV